MYVFKPSQSAIIIPMGNRAPSRLGVSLEPAGNSMERHKSDGLTDGKMADKHVDEAGDGFDDPTEG